MSACVAAPEVTPYVTLFKATSNNYLSGHNDLRVFYMPSTYSRRSRLQGRAIRHGSWFPSFRGRFSMQVVSGLFKDIYSN